MILLVDDDATVLASLELLLRRAGFATARAAIALVAPTIIRLSSASWKIASSSSVCVLNRKISPQYVPPGPAASFVRFSRPPSRRIAIRSEVIRRMWVWRLGSAASQVVNA